MDRHRFGVFINRSIFAAVIGIFVFASCSLSASLPLFVPEGFDQVEDHPSSPLHFIPIGTLNFPDTPFSEDPGEDELPAALRSSCEAFSSTRSFNVRTRNKTAPQFAEWFYTSGDGSCPLASILDRSFYGSGNICAKAFYSVKTTRKLE